MDEKAKEREKRLREIVEAELGCRGARKEKLGNNGFERDDDGLER